MATNMSKKRKFKDVFESEPVDNAQQCKQIKLQQFMDKIPSMKASTDCVALYDFYTQFTEEIDEYINDRWRTGQNVARFATRKELDACINEQKKYILDSMHDKKLKFKVQPTYTKAILESSDYDEFRALFQHSYSVIYVTLKALLTEFSEDLIEIFSEYACTAFYRCNGCAKPLKGIECGKDMQATAGYESQVFCSNTKITDDEDNANPASEFYLNIDDADPTDAEDADIFFLSKFRYRIWCGHCANQARCGHCGERNDLTDWADCSYECERCEITYCYGCKGDSDDEDYDEDAYELCPKCRHKKNQ